MRGFERALLGRCFAALLFLTCALAVPACQAILGLNQFEKFECGDACADAALEDARDAGADSAFQFGEASVAQRWARWRMPNPKNAEVQDNVAAYDAQAGGVKDLITGLEWSTQVSPEKVYPEAFRECEQKGMRLPTRIELVSLLDYVSQNGIDPAFADNGTYWTQSPVLPERTKVWAVTFGKPIAVIKYDLLERAPPKAKVRCVR